ncbi:MAG: RNA polymerase sigma factor [Planctomycetes bacterium]|nr:RNA polymerase sigma factor [Planctomycetota bacterium]
MDSERTDAELVRAAAAGDEGAFDALYARHRDWVFALALRSTGRRDEALDVAQEAFVELLERLDSPGGLVLTGSLRAYLRPIVRHRAIDAARRAGREPRAETALEELLDRVAVEAGGAADLARVLRGLPSEQRELVLLRFVDGFELAEIAETLALPLGTVKSRLHQALANLRGDPRVARFLDPEG